MPLADAVTFGSSPRVWGRLVRLEDAGTGERFIPTRVGQTRNGSRVLATGSVHPHACGADLMPMDRCSIVTTGSSPRVWGRRIQHRLRGGAQWRFIPTRVGQTCQTPKKTALPKRFIPTRVGQTLADLPVLTAEHGSSPRVWGRPRGSAPCAAGRSVHPHACGADLSDAKRGYASLRFIPTRVGQTSPAISPTRSSPGSSPRVWGRRLKR